MEISPDALRRILSLKRRRHMASSIGLRLGLRGSRVYLRWDPSGPREDDFRRVQGSLPIFIDAKSYARLAELRLDFEALPSGGRFVLRPRIRGNKPRNHGTPVAPRGNQ